MVLLMVLFYKVQQKHRQQEFRQVIYLLIYIQYMLRCHNL